MISLPIGGFFLGMPLGMYLLGGSGALHLGHFLAALGLAIGGVKLMLSNH
jgi:hypothetical protein